MEQKEESEAEDSEIDDCHIRYEKFCIFIGVAIDIIIYATYRLLLQMKKSVETLKKYDDINDYNMDGLDVSHLSVQKIIQSPLKLSLSQIFQGQMNDFLDSDEIKRKYYQQLGRDFHYSPNYEANSNIGN
jgi:hypothetical protein